jgi:hypothetical protein
MGSGFPRHFQATAHDWSQVLTFQGKTRSVFRVIYHLHFRNYSL